MAASAVRENNNKAAAPILTGDSRNDPVNHPSHYTYGSIETIDFIESMGLGTDFCLGNVIKYVSRAGHKGDAVEDLRKARWYLNRAIMELEGGGLNRAD